MWVLDKLTHLNLGLVYLSLYLQYLLSNKHEWLYITFCYYRFYFAYILHH
ncbi:hypothetical protein DI53_3369 [Sphingobacterium deserti]|uniref:Uncharacterized protein n=1 Tax=Sphingobacterium deserti TaxID=1229276 RepID=A0A0B8SZ62_9SPHI|nr:hypothetical protein DI53_3369 [Sphingobacterium deserti]